MTRVELEKVIESQLHAVANGRSPSKAMAAVRRALDSFFNGILEDIAAIHTEAD